MSRAEAHAFHESSFARFTLSRADQVIRELTEAFELGSDASQLDARGRDILETLMAQIEAARPGESRAPAPLEKGRLDVRGLSRDEGGNEFSLTKLEQEAFANYGLLPPHSLRSLSPNAREDLEHTVDLIKACGMSSTFGYLFSKEILDLALNPEIVERVASLIGGDITLTATSGPMYREPMSTAKTEWHAANGKLFGAAQSGSNLNLVTVWVSLNGARVESGCMKIVPGSFDFVHEAHRALDYRPAAPLFNSLPPEVRCVAAPIGRALEGSVSKAWARQVIVRALNAPNTAGMWLKEQQRADPFHLSLNEFFSTDAKLDPELGCVAMEADPGDCYLFSSQNLHGSFCNQTRRWRKAIALRYMATGDVIGANLADGHEQVAEYKAAFGESSAEFWKALNLDRRYYMMASPRICVKGSMPEGRAALYVDLDILREGLERDDDHWGRVYARRGLTWLDNPRALKRR